MWIGLNVCGLNYKFQFTPRSWCTNIKFFSMQLHRRDGFLIPRGTWDGFFAKYSHTTSLLLVSSYVMHRCVFLFVIAIANCFQLLQIIIYISMVREWCFWFEHTVKNISKLTNKILTICELFCSHVLLSHWPQNNIRACLSMCYARMRETATSSIQWIVYIL